MQAKVLIGAALLLTAALAGCTAQLDAKQTEPFKIRVEHVDGDGSGSTGTTGTTTTNRVTINVDSNGQNREQRVVIEKDVQVENLRIVVNVHADDDTQGTTSPPLPPPPPPTGGNGTGNQTGGNQTGGNQTGGNDTGTGTTTSTEVVVRVIVQTEDGEVLEQQDVTTTGGTGNADLTVNVKGKNNVVVITQAVQGAASVDVDATEAKAEAGGS